MLETCILTLANSEDRSDQNEGALEIAYSHNRLLGRNLRSRPLEVFASVYAKSKGEMDDDDDGGALMSKVDSGIDGNGSCFAEIGGDAYEDFLNRNRLQRNILKNSALPSHLDLLVLSRAY